MAWFGNKGTQNIMQRYSLSTHYTAKIWVIVYMKLQNIFGKLMNEVGWLLLMLLNRVSKEKNEFSGFSSSWNALKRSVSSVCPQRIAENTHNFTPLTSWPTKLNSQPYRVAAVEERTSDWEQMKSCKLEWGGVERPWWSWRYWIPDF